MEEKFFENACETLSILVTALGAGLAVWGVINLLEAYETGAEKEEIAGEYRSRIAEIDLLLQGAFADNSSGKITLSQYKALCAEYDAEMEGLLEALYGLDAEIAAQKRKAVNQILNAGSLALIAPIIHKPDDVQYALDYVAEKRRVNGAMPV